MRGHDEWLEGLGSEPRCTLVLEPVGSEYELLAGDAVVLHVYGSSVGPGDKDADIEVERSDGRITVWLTSADYSAWDAAGNELTAL